MLALAQQFYYTAKLDHWARWTWTLALREHFDQSPTVHTLRLLRANSIFCSSADKRACCCEGLNEQQVAVATQPLEFRKKNVKPNVLSRVPLFFFQNVCLAGRLPGPSILAFARWGPSLCVGREREERGWEERCSPDWCHNELKTVQICDAYVLIK